MHLTLTQWLLAAAAAILTGFSKTGVLGLGVLIVPLMAMVFPAKLSVGALLPMLLVADVFAIVYYRRHAQWDRLWGLFPWLVVGMALGYAALKRMDDATLKLTLGWLVLVLLAVELARRRWGWPQVSHHWTTVMVTGVGAGFATTVSNMAGSIMTIYLASKGLNKNEFMGTAAWYFFIVNAAKVPLFSHLGIITTETLQFNALVVPGIVLGAVAGKRLLPVIPQTVFNGLVLALAGVAALRLVLF
jgi:uncharacterized protein